LLGIHFEIHHLKFQDNPIVGPEARTAGLAFYWKWLLQYYKLKIVKIALSTKKKEIEVNAGHSLQ
jgi:hypothetical protein